MDGLDAFIKLSVPGSEMYMVCLASDARISAVDELTRP